LPRPESSPWLCSFWVLFAASAARGLTPPSRGQPQAGFAHLRLPLTSNVRHHAKIHGRCPVSQQSNSPAAFPPAIRPCLASPRGGQAFSVPSLQTAGPVPQVMVGVPSKQLQAVSGWCPIPVGLFIRRKKSRASLAGSASAGPQRLAVPSSQCHQWSNRMFSVGLRVLPCPAPVPNPSVKGTCLRQASYVER
jgi:hypothetical protein